MRISISLEPGVIRIHFIWQEPCDDLDADIDFIKSWLARYPSRKIILDGMLPDAYTEAFLELAEPLVNRSVSLSKSLLLDSKGAATRVAHHLIEKTTLVLEPALMMPENMEAIAACLGSLSPGVKVEFDGVPPADKFQSLTQAMPMGIDIGLPSGVSCRKVLNPETPTSLHTFIIKLNVPSPSASSSSSTSLVSDDAQSIDMSVFRESTVSPDASMPHDVLVRMVRALQAETTFWMPDGVTQDQAIALAQALPRKVTLMLPSDKNEQELAAIVAATMPMSDIEIFIPHTLTALQATSIAAATPRGNTVLLDLFIPADNPEAKQAKSERIKKVAGAMQSGSRVAFLKDEAQEPDDVAPVLEAFIQALTQPEVILCIPDWVDLSFWDTQPQSLLGKHTQPEPLLDKLKVPCILELEPNDERGVAMVKTLPFGSSVIITDNDPIEPSWLEKIAAAMPAGATFHLPHVKTIEVAQKVTAQLPSGCLLGLHMTPETCKVYLTAIRHKQRKAACLVALAPELSGPHLHDILGALNTCVRSGDSVVLLPGATKDRMGYLMENMPATTEFRLAPTVPSAEARIFAKQLGLYPDTNFRLMDDMSDAVLLALVSSLTHFPLRLDFTLSSEKMVRLLSYLAPNNTLVLSPAADEALAEVIASNLNANIDLWLPSGLKDTVLDILARCVTSRNRLLLSGDMTVTEVSRLARAISSLDSLVLDSLSPEAQEAASCIMEERRRHVNISATMVLEDSEVRAQIDQAVASGKALRLLPGLDYLTALRYLPKQAMLSISAQPDALLLDALNTSSLPLFHLLLDSDMSESRIQTLCSALRPGAHVILPENMPLASMQAVARSLPRQGSLEFKGRVSKATLFAVVNALTSLATFVVPTVLCQDPDDEGLLAPSWLKELISTISRDKQIVIQLPSGMNLEVLKALADASMTANLRFLLSQKMSLEEVRSIVVACRQTPERGLSDSASIEFPKDMSRGALVELAMMPGLNIILPADASLGEVRIITENMRHGRLIPRATTNDVLAVLASNTDPSCTIVLSTRLNLEQLKVIAYNAHPGLTLRVSGDFKPEQLSTIAQHARPEVILEVSSAVMSNVSHIATNLHPGAILRLPDTSTPAQLAEVAVTLAAYAILEMPPIAPQGADHADTDAWVRDWAAQIKQWLVKLNPKAIVTFSAKLYQDMMTACEQTLQMSGASNQTALASAKRAYAQEMVRSIFKEIIQSLPQDCGLLLPSELDKAELGHLISYLPKNCVFWLSSTMRYEKVQHLATAIMPPDYELCVGVPLDGAYTQGTVYLQKSKYSGQKIDVVARHANGKVLRDQIDMPVDKSLEELLERSGYREFILRALAMKQYIPMNSGIKLGCVSLTESDAFQLADVFGQRWDGDHSLAQRRLVEAWLVVRWPVTNHGLNHLRPQFNGIPLTWVDSPIIAPPPASLPVKIGPLYSQQTSSKTRTVTSNASKRGTRPEEQTHGDRLKKQRGQLPGRSGASEPAGGWRSTSSFSSVSSLTFFGAQYTSHDTSHASFAPSQGHPPYSVDPVYPVTHGASPYYPPSHVALNPERTGYSGHPGYVDDALYPRHHEYSQNPGYPIGSSFSDASTSSSYCADPHLSRTFNDEQPWPPMRGLPETNKPTSSSSSSYCHSSDFCEPYAPIKDDDREERKPRDPRLRN